MNLRRQINNINKKQISYTKKNVERNNQCQLKPGTYVLYKGETYMILDNNTARGHNHQIQNVDTMMVYSIINCMELTLI